MSPMIPTVKQNLYIVTGASGVGKTRTCEILFRREKEYIVLNSDILWENRFNTPSDNYRAFRERWMRLAAAIAQIGLPVVLEGSGLPDHYMNLPERDLFIEIRFLALVCSNEELESRMRQGRGITDEAWIESSVSFNTWLIDHAAETSPPITRLDTTELTLEEAARKVDQWIRSSGRLDQPAGS